MTAFIFPFRLGQNTDYRLWGKTALQGEATWDLETFASYTTHTKPLSCGGALRLRSEKHYSVIKRSQMREAHDVVFKLRDICYTNQKIPERRGGRHIINHFEASTVLHIEQLVLKIKDFQEKMILEVEAYLFQNKFRTNSEIDKQLKNLTETQKEEVLKLARKYYNFTGKLQRVRRQ
tara:strand:+ start:1039 stop:1569 length:531 start_codon:yes stop_codon:yes gene_type:complete